VLEGFFKKVSTYPLDPLDNGKGVTNKPIVVVRNFQEPKDCCSQKMVGKVGSPPQVSHSLLILSEL
jgi:hypothetical protein